MNAHRSFAGRFARRARATAIRSTPPVRTMKVNIEFYSDPADGVFKALLD